MERLTPVSLFILLVPMVVAWVMAWAMVKLVAWARRRSGGAVVTGALFSVMAPDPTLEHSVRLRDEAAAKRQEEEGEGEPRDPGAGGRAAGV